MKEIIQYIQQHKHLIKLSPSGKRAAINNIQSLRNITEPRARIIYNEVIQAGVCKDIDVAIIIAEEISVIKQKYDHVKESALH